MDTDTSEKDKIDFGQSGPFERSIETSELIKKLSLLNQGDLIKYGDLATIAMGDCSPGGLKYHYLLSARRALLNKYNMVFRAVPNEGLERLVDAQIVARSVKKLANVTRAAKKEMRILTFVDFDKLSPEQMLTHNTNMSILNVMKTVGQADKINKIKNQIGNMGNRLEIAETIKAFQGR